MEQRIIGANLLRIREARGLTQSDVAGKAGISRAAYRSIEIGEATPKVSTLQNIAKGLNIKLNDLFIPVRTLKKVRFRAMKKMNNREHILTEVARWLDDFHFLEDLIDGKSILYSFKDFRINNTDKKGLPARPRLAAELARKILKLNDDEPIRNIAGLLESNGIKVYSINIATDGFFGLSVSEEEGGPAIIVNVWDRISVERWIFSAAHELGHLLLHLDSFNADENEEDEKQELEANIFASYFLMPEQTFESEWKKTYGLPFVTRVLKVKRIFQVSYKTVLYRLSESEGSMIWGKFQSEYRLKVGKTLSRTDEPDAIPPSKYLQSMPEVLRSQEPESLSSSDFIEDRLFRYVRLAIEKDLITMGRGAEILRMDLDSMRELVSSWSQ